MGTIKVHLGDGKVDIVPSNKLITRWLFGNGELLTMSHIAKKSGVPMKMKEAHEYEFTKQFWKEINTTRIPTSYKSNGVTVPSPNVPKLSKVAVKTATALLRRAITKVNKK